MLSKLPIAFAGRGIDYPVSLLPAGTATASRAQVVQILVTPERGHAYLEPAYRFSGVVRVPKHGAHAWHALAPAAQR